MQAALDMTSSFFIGSEDAFSDVSDDDEQDDLRTQGELDKQIETVEEALNNLKAKHEKLKVAYDDLVKAGDAASKTLAVLKLSSSSLHNKGRAQAGATLLVSSQNRLPGKLAASAQSGSSLGHPSQSPSRETLLREYLRAELKLHRDAYFKEHTKLRAELARHGKMKISEMGRLKDQVSKQREEVNQTLRAGRQEDTFDVVAEREQRVAAMASLWAASQGHATLQAVNARNNQLEAGLTVMDMAKQAAFRERAFRAAVVFPLKAPAPPPRGRVKSCLSNKSVVGPAVVEMGSFVSLVNPPDGGRGRCNTGRAVTFAAEPETAYIRTDASFAICDEGNAHSTREGIAIIDEGVWWGDPMRDRKKSTGRGSFYLAVIVAVACPIRRSAKLATFLLFIVCATVQLILSCWLLQAMSEPNIDPGLVQRLQAWAASRDPVFGGGVCLGGHTTTTACHACAARDGDSASRYGQELGFWSWEADRIETYTEIHGPQRRLFILCACFVFATCVLKEFASIVNIIATLAIPLKSQSGEGYQYVPGKRRGELRSLSVVAKFCVVLVVAVRTTVLYGLLRWGMALVAQPATFKDLLLHCCGLALILKFDEIFLLAFGFEQLQHTVRTLDLPFDLPELDADGRKQAWKLVRPLVEYPLVLCAWGFAVAFLATLWFTNGLLEFEDSVVELCAQACLMACPNATGALQQMLA